MKLPSLAKLKEIPMTGRVVNTILILVALSVLVSLFGNEQVSEWMNYFIGMEN